MKKLLKVTVNGKLRELYIEPNALLVEVLRDELGYLGVKRGCSSGMCGACTVNLDGKAVKSCLILAMQANGREILTIEGLEKDGEMHPLQTAFVNYGAVQCGFCTPGMIMSAHAFLKENPVPSEDDVRTALSGNLCRCTGYVKIIEAVLAVAEGKEINNRQDEVDGWVGKSIPKPDAKIKATGKAKYCFDLELPHMLYAKVKRSPYPHAKIINIDTTEAENLPGVEVVIVGNEETSPHRGGNGLSDEFILARDKVLYVGDPLAAVAAESEEIAQRAVDLIEVEYEELPAVFDGEEAFSTNPPTILHEDLSEYTVNKSLSPKLSKERPNQFNEFNVRKGNVEKGFAEADLVVDNRFTTSMIQHCQMEPHNAVASMDENGILTVWGTNQKPYSVQQTLSEATNIPLHKIRCIVPASLGGGFGGREPKAEMICAALVLAQKDSHRPVKYVYTREEMLSTATTRAHFIIDVKTGVTKDGKITAQKVRQILVGGAYTGSGLLTARNGAFGTCVNYQSPNFQMDAYGVYTNQRPCGSFRGFGNGESLWGLESHMDTVAERLGMDKLKFRKLNAMREGALNAFSEKMHSVGAVECLDKVAEAIKWKVKSQNTNPDIRRGKGIALGNKYSLAPTASSAIVKMHSDKFVEARVSTVDMGQGSSTAFAQMVADRLGISPNQIRVLNPDTSVTPFDQGTFSQRSTFGMGNALGLACDDLKKELFELAAPIIGVSAEKLETRDFKVFVKDDPEKVINISDMFVPVALSGKTLKEGGELMGKASFYLGIDPPDPETSQSNRLCAFYTYIAQGAEVEVNIRTGAVKVIQFASATELGKTINPMIMEGQVDGGALSMGIGSALLEKVVTDNGAMLNANYVDYKIPTTLDVPKMMDSKAILLENAPHREGPFGAKGAGEGTMIVSAPAIANAIYDAIGIRFDNIPITAEDVINALEEKK